MLKPIPVRTWATPLVIGSFVLMSATGVLMFLGQDRGLISGVHRWFSWIFLAGAGGHIAMNLRAFKKHLNSRWGTGLLIASAVILAGSFLSWGIVTARQVLPPVERALVTAPLTTLASLTQAAPETLLNRLKSQGITATSQQSLHEVAGQNGVSEDRLLAMVFVPR